MIKSLVWTAGALLLAGWGSARGAEGAFWEQDVWRQPDRPFLYYGMQPGTRAKKNDTQTDPANDIQTDPPASTLSVDAEKRARQKLESIATLPDLQAEVKARLEAAVMDPTPEAIALYL
ncbi:MAG: hypothetical protein ACI4SV_01110, partial [Duodenibacillus sp.]